MASPRKSSHSSINKKPANRINVGRGQVPQKNGLTVSPVQTLPTLPPAGDAAPRATLPNRPPQASPPQMASSSSNQGQVRVRSTHPSEEYPLLCFTRCAAIPATIAKQEQLQHRLAVCTCSLKPRAFQCQEKNDLASDFLEFLLLTLLFRGCKDHVFGFLALSTAFFHVQDEIVL